MKTLALLLLLSQDVLAERVMLEQTRNTAGSSHKKNAINNRLKHLRDDNNHVNRHSKSLESLTSGENRNLLTDSAF